MKAEDKLFCISRRMKFAILCLISISAIIVSSWAGAIRSIDVIESDIDNKLFLNELQNAVYVGNCYAVEAVGNLIVSHNIISRNPRKETVKGYMSFMANDSVNKEMGNIGVISEFDLREPSNRVCHEIIKVGEKIQVGSEILKINLFVGDPVIFDYSPTKLYYVFRCGMNDSSKGCTVGCFVDKTTFSIEDAHFITFDGNAIANLSSPQNIWSNTRILKYKDRYYRSFRDNISKRIVIARSTDLFNWTTWLDISSAMTFVKGTEKTSFDETDIAIDDVNGVLYFAVRSTSVVVGKVKMSDKPSVENMSSVAGITPTRPSLVFFNGELYLFCNTHKDNDSNKILNSIIVQRSYPALFRLNTNLVILHKWSGCSCIGGNYQVIYSYGSQLLCGLNFNKQGLSNTASLERCGVYFTSLYSICNSY